MRISKRIMLLPCVAVFTASAQSLTNRPALYHWATGAAAGRADIVMLGDSNQLKDGYGWNGGYIDSLKVSRGLYATGLLWAGENSGAGAQDGEGYYTISSGSGVFAYAGAPQAVGTYAQFSSPQCEYLYLPSGAVSGARNMGMVVAGALNTSAALRWWLTDCTFPDAGGSYSPAVRLAAAPYSTVASFGSISTGGGYGLRTQSFFMSPDGNRTGPLEFRYAPYTFSTALTAPLLFLWTRCEEINVATGVSVHTLYYWGGKSARQMAASMQSASDEMLTAYFSEVRRLQGAEKYVLIRLSQGVNDINETLPSVPHGITPGSSPAAFADNMGYCIDRIQGIWETNGWAQDELTFLISCAHALGAADDPKQVRLVAYRQAATGLIASHPNLAVCDLAAEVPYATMLSSGYYITPAPGQPVDTAHLSRLGYQALSQIETASLIQGPPCPADFNQDGGVDGPDIEAFFTAWSNADGVADVNFDGGIDGGDIETFFAAWERGGC